MTSAVLMLLSVASAGDKSTYINGRLDPALDWREALPPPPPPSLLTPGGRGYFVFLPPVHALLAGDGAGWSLGGHLASLYTYIAHLPVVYVAAAVAVVTATAAVRGLLKRV